MSYPLPGTRFYDLVKLQLGAKKNWNDSDDLSMMFEGRFGSEFYLALRDALHAEVDGAPEEEVAALVVARERHESRAGNCWQEERAVALWTSC